MDIHDKGWASYAPQPLPLRPELVPRLQGYMYSMPPGTTSDMIQTELSPDDVTSTYMNSRVQGLSPSTSVAGIPPRRSSFTISKSFPGYMSQPTTPNPSSPALQESSLDRRFHPGHVSQDQISARRRRRESMYSQDDSPPFVNAKYHAKVYGADHTLLDVRLLCRIDRGFFMADNDWTCYRRNYFQVSGSFGLHTPGTPYDNQDMPCLVEVDGTLRPVQCFLFGITSTIASSDKKITLVQHTPKRDKGPQNVPETRVIRPGGNLALSSSANQTVITFERVQFKSATANNGKRRAAQQYYVLHAVLYAKTDTDNLVTLATAESAPLVVRGRSPGHYAETDTQMRQGAPHHHRPSLSGSTSDFYDHASAGEYTPTTPQFGHSLTNVMPSTPHAYHHGAPIMPNLHDRSASSNEATPSSEAFPGAYVRQRYPTHPSDDHPSWSRARMASNTSHTSVESARTLMSAPPHDYSFYSHTVSPYHHRPTLEASPHQSSAPLHHPPSGSHLASDTYSHTSSPYQSMYDTRKLAPAHSSPMPAALQPSGPMADRGYPSPYPDMQWRPAPLRSPPEHAEHTSSETNAHDHPTDRNESATAEAPA